jgi:predicted small lipoprotein YifL
MIRTKLFTLALLLVLAALLLPLAACGKRAPPEPPPGEVNQFPRTYPNPNGQ